MPPADVDALKAELDRLSQRVADLDARADRRFDDLESDMHAIQTDVQTLRGELRVNIAEQVQINKRADERLGELNVQLRDQAAASRERHTELMSAVRERPVQPPAASQSAAPLAVTPQQIVAALVGLAVLSGGSAAAIDLLRSVLGVAAP